MVSQCIAKRACARVLNFLSSLAFCKGVLSRNVAADEAQRSLCRIAWCSPNTRVAVLGRFCTVTVFVLPIVVHLIKIYIDVPAALTYFSSDILYIFVCIQYEYGSVLTAIRLCRPKISRLPAVQFSISPPCNHCQRLGSSASTCVRCMLSIFVCALALCKFVVDV